MIHTDDPSTTYLTAVQAAAAAHVPAGTIRTWVRRQLLAPVPGVRPQAFRELDVLDAELRTRDRRRGERLRAEALGQLADLERQRHPPRAGLLTFAP
jgi:hypothetical protein